MRRATIAVALLLATACASRQKGAPPAPGQDKVAPALTGAPGPGETVRELDLNHDGRTDVWVYSVKGADGKELVTRKEKDLNGDGKIDTWEYYGADGLLSRLTYDMDFDGKPDVTLLFEKDQLVRKEYAFGFDGVPHSFNYYERNRLVRKERDANGDGRIDTWEYWENGEADRIGVDNDGDGQVDRWETRKTAQGAAPEAAPKK